MIYLRAMHQNMTKTVLAESRTQIASDALAASLESVNNELRDDGHRFRHMIDALPVAIYTTDAWGRLTHFNPACVELSGRHPEFGTDQWCVSWKLYYPDGTPMSHDESPMALALKEGRAIHGAEAILERPDGTRRWFAPYPMPLRDSEGRIIGGINMLVDITERKQPNWSQRPWHKSFSPRRTPLSAKTLMASSPVGTQARNVSSATPPPKPSAVRLRCSSHQSAGGRNAKSLSACGGAKPSSISKLSAGAKMAHSWKYL
jgi:PAS domain S-box-containing protein